MWREFGFLFSY